MSREPDERFGDILAAIERCLQYRAHPAESDESIASMAYDAVLRNLAVIGEAVKALPPEATAGSPETPWASIAGSGLGRTPWDPRLASEMSRRGVRIEEELVLDDLLRDLAFGRKVPA